MLFLFVFVVFGVNFTFEDEFFLPTLTKGHVFVFDLAKHFNISGNELEQGYHYAISESDRPDLPSWLFTKKDSESKRAYLFGAPPLDYDILTLEIRTSCTTYHNYRTRSGIIILKMEPMGDISNGIRIRISNSNIIQMLETNRSQELIEIFENYFWEQAKGKLYLTFLAASDDLGFRLPSSPSETAGVVMHLGSSENFSQSLFDLQTETIPLSKHCPQDFYKRVTVERFFRPKNFVVDWCFFKLINYEKCQDNPFYAKIPKCDDVNAPQPHNFTSNFLSGDIEKLTEKEKLPNSEMLEVFAVVVFVPSILVMLSLISWLISFMCLHHSKLYDPYSDDYFETVFFICEDFGRKDDECSLDEDFNKMQSSYMI